MRDGKVAFAVVGCGVIGPFHTKCIDACERATLVALCDVEKDKADKLAAEHGGDIATHADYRRMLDAEGDVDVVCVCTPSGIHWKVACAVAGRGRRRRARTGGAGGGKGFAMRWRTCGRQAASAAAGRGRRRRARTGGAGGSGSPCDDGRAAGRRLVFRQGRFSGWHNSPSCVLRDVSPHNSESCATNIKKVDPRVRC